MDLDAFCNDVVPDFTPLGGNRPDCAVVMAAVVSFVEGPRQQHCGTTRSYGTPLWDNPSVSNAVVGRSYGTPLWDDPSLWNASSPSLLLLPPDVLDTAMAMVCARIIIRSASDRIEPLPNNCGSRTCGGRLSCRLEVASDAALDGCRGNWYDSDNDDDVVACERFAMPHLRDFDTVCLQIALPDSIDSTGDDFLQRCTNLVFIDLRNTKIRTVGNHFMCGCTKVTCVQLPDTLQTVGKYFLHYCTSLVSIDLRSTMLHTVCNEFMSTCIKLTAVHLPDTLHKVCYNFLSHCSSLVSIDLRHTNLRSAPPFFMYGCHQLAEIHLPDTLQTVGMSFLADCRALAEEEVARIKRSIEERADETTSDTR